MDDDATLADDARYFWKEEPGQTDYNDTYADRFAGARSGAEGSGAAETNAVNTLPEDSLTFRVTAAANSDSAKIDVRIYDEDT